MLILHIHRSIFLECTQRLYLGTTSSYQSLFDLFYLFTEGNHHTTATLVLIMQYAIIQDLQLCLDNQPCNQRHSTNGKRQTNNSVNHRKQSLLVGVPLCLCNQFAISPQGQKGAEVMIRSLYWMSTGWRELSRRNVTKQAQHYFRVYQIYKIREPGDNL